jgi:hypothetical protein
MSTDGLKLACLVKNYDDADSVDQSALTVAEVLVLAPPIFHLGLALPRLSHD